MFHGKPFKDNQVSTVYLLWLDGDYTYSIGIYREDGTGLTADEMTGLVKAAK